MSAKTLLLIGVVAAFVLLGGVVSDTSGWRKVKNAQKYLPKLNAAELRYGIPHDLLARQAYQESHFRDDIVSGAAVSSAGALGLMQLVPRYHPSVDPLDVDAAIDYAARFMVELRNRFGSWRLALAAYNAGPGNVAKYNGVPPFEETQAYVNNILSDVKVA